MATRLAFVLGIVFMWPLALLAAAWMLIRSTWAVAVRLPSALVRRIV